MGSRDLNHEILELSERFLNYAKNDLKAAVDLYQCKRWLPSLFYFSQSIEKSSKAVYLLSLIQYKDPKKYKDIKSIYLLLTKMVGHNSIKAYYNILYAVSENFHGYEMSKDKIKGMLPPQVDEMILDHSSELDLRIKKFKTIMQNLSTQKKIIEYLNKEKNILQLKDLIKNLSGERRNKSLLDNIEAFGKSVGILFILGSVCSNNHTNYIFKYPLIDFEPIDTFTENHPLIKNLEFFMDSLRKTITNIEQYLLIVRDPSKYSEEIKNILLQKVISNEEADN